MNEFEDVINGIKEGKIFPEEDYVLIIKAAITKKSNKKILLKGFPRTIEDMEIWDKEMKGIVNIKAALYLEVSTEEMKKRELERKEKRFIDNEKCIDQRIYIFETMTKQVLSIFERREMLIRIDGMKTVDEIEKDVIEKFKDKNIK